MQKRKGKLEELALMRDSEEVIVLFETMLRYLEVLDLDEGTNHTSIFKALYLGEPKTYRQIADQHFICVDTLRRYVEHYNELIQKIAKKICNHNNKNHS